MGETIVTTEGQLFAADGSLTGGRGEGVGAHMIAVKREIKLTGKLDGDAVQASLSRLADAVDLPEYRGKGATPATAAGERRKDH